MLIQMDGFVDGSSEQAMVADRAGAALFGTFVGDALGMPFEGLPRELIPRHVEMVEARLGRGTYTDDTQMMVALAESLIARGRVDVEHLSRAFLDAYDVERGYGGGTRRVLELWRAGVAVDVAAAQVFDGQGSRGNGAAMRIAPVAVCFRDDHERLCVEAAASARVTHAHPVGVDGAVVQAAAIAGPCGERTSFPWHAPQHRLRSCAGRLRQSRSCWLLPRRPGSCTRAYEARPTLLSLWRQGCTWRLRTTGSRRRCNSLSAWEETLTRLPR